MRACLLFVISALSLQLIAQNPGSENAHRELREFNAWKADHDLSKEQGWKWYARHKAYEASRLDGKGQLPSILSIQKEYQKVSSLKKVKSSAARAGSSWAPYGPVNRPPSTRYYASHNLGRINCVAFHPTDSNIIYTGVAQGGVWKSENHGNSWRPLTDSLPIIRISDIAINSQNPDEMYICMGDYAYIGAGLSTDGRKRNTHYGIGVYRSDNGGESWNPTSLGFEQSSEDASLMRRVIFDTLPGRVVAAGVSGIWESLDSGNTWTQLLDSLIWDIEEDPNQKGVLYASTGYVFRLEMGSAGIIKSTDFGRTWKKLNTGIPAKDAQRVELGISPSDSNYVYAVACDLDRGLQGFYRSTDAGATWTKRADQPNILEWSDGSGTGGQGTYDLAIMVDPRNKERVYVGGVNVWGSEDGGLTWQGASYWSHRDGYSTHADQHFFKHNALDDKFYVCNDGGLYRTDSIAFVDWSNIPGSPSGFRWPTNWENITDGMQITAFYRVGSSLNNPGTVIAGAQDNGTYYKHQSNWTNVYGGDGMDCLIDPDNPSTIYMSSQYGNLVRSYNAGQNLSSISNIPSSEEGGWTTPMAMHPQQSSTIYAGFGNLYRSTSNGSFWQSLSNFPIMQGFAAPNIISCFAIAEQNPEKIYLGKRVYFEYGEPSSVWKREFGQWTNIGLDLPDSLYPTSIEVNGAGDDTAWVTYGGFVEGVKVFQTNDGGQNWINISDSLPNIPVNVIKYQQRSALNTLYLGTDLGVYYKNDSITSWTLYSDGLPNVIVSDLELQYNEEKLYASTFGRGIWLADLLDTSLAVPVDTAGPSGLFQFQDLKKLQVFPSPNNGNFSIQIEGIHEGPAQIVVLDVNGRIAFEESISLNSKFKKNYSLKLEAGLYYLGLIKGNSTKYTSFVVSGIDN